MDTFVYRRYKYWQDQGAESLNWTIFFASYSVVELLPVYIFYLFDWVYSYAGNIRYKLTGMKTVSRFSGLIFRAQGRLCDRGK